MPSRCKLDTRDTFALSLNRAVVQQDIRSRGETVLGFTFSEMRAVDPWIRLFELIPWKAKSDLAAP